MCTAFPDCWVGMQRLLEVIYANIFTGRFVAGPRALRPERLQWLTTSAVNIQASMRTNLWNEVKKGEAVSKNLKPESFRNPASTVGHRSGAIAGHQCVGVTIPS